MARWRVCTLLGRDVRRLQRSSRNTYYYVTRPTPCPTNPASHHRTVLLERFMTTQKLLRFSRSPAATRPATLQRNADTTAPAFLLSPRFLETRSRGHVSRVAIPQACSNTRGPGDVPSRLSSSRYPLFAQFFQNRIKPASMIAPIIGELFRFLDFPSFFPVPSSLEKFGNSDLDQNIFRNVNIVEKSCPR